MSTRMSGSFDFDTWARILLKQSVHFTSDKIHYLVEVFSSGRRARRVRFIMEVYGTKKSRKDSSYLSVVKGTSMSRNRGFLWTSQFPDFTKNSCSFGNKFAMSLKNLKTVAHIVDDIEMSRFFGLVRRKKNWKHTSWLCFLERGSPLPTTLVLFPFAYPLLGSFFLKEEYICFLYFVKRETAFGPT